MNTNPLAALMATEDAQLLSQWASQTPLALKAGEELGQALESANKHDIDALALLMQDAPRHD